MTSLTLHARGAASAAEAWERYAVPARWSEWSPQISGVDTDAARIAPGVTGRVRGPGRVPLVSFVVEEVDEPGRRWTWRVSAGPVRLRLHHGVQDDRAGSRTWLTVEGPLPVVLSYAPLARLALGKLVAR